MTPDMTSGTAAPSASAPGGVLGAPRLTAHSSDRACAARSQPVVIQCAASYASMTDVGIRPRSDTS